MILGGWEKKASLSYHANMHAPFQLNLYVTVQSSTLPYFLYPQWKTQNYDLQLQKQDSKFQSDITRQSKLYPTQTKKIKSV